MNQPALVIVDMLKDTFEKHPEATIVRAALACVPRINALAARFRRKHFPVIFSCDSFLPEDFIFKGQMKPHSIRNTVGAQIIDQLDRAPSDIVSEKRRFSGFFKTDLDQTLRTYGVDTVVTAGIATHICVLSTVLDAVANDFHAVLLADGCAAHTAQIHDHITQTYARTPLYPLLRVMTIDALEDEIA